jgi:phosphomannomutase
MAMSSCVTVKEAPMNIAPGIFKAYDIRGIYPTELNEEGAYAIGRAFVTFLGASEVIVGHDMRLSGPSLFEAVTRGIMDQGANVVNIGLVSTDQYYFACAQLGLPGMMVTASHNPKQYNGFKMVRQMPYLLSGAEGIQDLRRIVQEDAFAPASGKGSMRSVDLSEQFGCRTGQRDATGFQHIAARSDRKCHLGVLLHQQNGGALAIHLADDVEDLVHQNRRQTHRRLVQQHDARPAHHGAPDRQHLLLAAGECAAELCEAFA